MSRTDREQVNEISGMFSSSVFDNTSDTYGGTSVSSVLTGTSSASAVSALYWAIAEIAFGYAADTYGLIVRVLNLYAAETAKAFISLFLPLRNQIGISDALLKAVIVEFAGYRLRDELIVYVSRLCVMDLEDRP